MNSLCVVPLTLLLIIAGCGATRPLVQLPSKLKGHKKPLQTSRPFNVAHRGSNGELPEETAPAYMRAIDKGADFIETDILPTRDGVLICHHDVILDDTTNIKDHPEFAGRQRTYTVQGIKTTGFFVGGDPNSKTTQRFSFRDQQKIPDITFEEYISIALDAPRVVGIYPEIKNPEHINAHVKWPDGKKFEDVFVDILKKYGYKGSYLSKDWMEKPCFVQSFAPTSLIHISKQTDLPLIFLIDDVTTTTPDTNQTYAEITSDEYFDYIRQYCVGIGPWKDTIVPVGANNYLELPTDLIARAHAHDLQVHPYTYRLENTYLHYDFHQDAYNEYDFWIHKMGIDGLFTEFPGSLHQYQEWTAPLNSKGSYKIRKGH
ncbi:hypothetical protein Droror1_Dr00004591 [Drosera rotundifolia]